MSRDRVYDLVLFGATGFTGALTAAYLATHAPPGLRWALAGRKQAKLDAVRTRLAAFDPGLAELPLLHADAGSVASLRAIADATRVVATTVGPYIEHGEPLVAACVRAGTDYADISGESEFVDLMYLRHHEQAVKTGARLVHCCGFDSIPHDLGVYFTVRELPADVPIRVDGFVQANADYSGGTLQTAITVMSRLREARLAHLLRLRAEPVVKGRRVHATAGTPRHHAGLGVWTLPLPTADPGVVRRSALALDRYGPEFTYRHHLALKSLPAALGLAAGAAGVAALAQIAPLRTSLRALRATGEGPSAKRRATSWFNVHFDGRGGDRRVITKVSGGDPGYAETAKMLAESALCLAFDDLPETAGQVTTAEAMGDTLIGRLQRAGIAFEVLATADA